VLGLVAALAIVIGEVIGSGIFLKPNQVAQATGGYVGLILSLWVACGLINLCGALTLAELGAMMPHAGGTYVFLREAYGRMWGFLWCWAEFWVIRSGAIAALSTAVGLAAANLIRTRGDISPESMANIEKLVAIASIVLLATVNIIGTRWGSAVQVVTTAIKAGFLVFLAVLPFLAAGRQPLDLSPLWPAAMQAGLLAGIGSAIAGIMWAYDGWGQVTVVAEEIKNPQRNLPLALGLGVLFLIVLYTGANLGYHLTLPSAQIAAADVPAEAVTRALMGDFGAKLMLSMLLVSAFGALNSNVLVGPRVLFAIARDNVVLSPLKRIDPRFNTPALAIGVLSAWAASLVLLGDLTPEPAAPVPAPAVASSASAESPSSADAASAEPERPEPVARKPKKRLYDVLTDYAIFGGSMFYFAAVAAVFVFRFRRPDLPRPYRTWGYPVVPLVFMAGYVFIIGSMFWAAPRECLTGILLIAAGVPFYWLTTRRREQPV
jgi:amino acid transporter